MQKIDYFWSINYSKEIIYINEDRINIVIYEEERRNHLEFLENLDYDDDNNLGQCDTEYWFNDEE